MAPAVRGSRQAPDLSQVTIKRHCWRSLGKAGHGNPHAAGGRELAGWRGSSVWRRPVAHGGRALNLLPTRFKSASMKSLRRGTQHQVKKLAFALNTSILKGNFRSPPYMEN